MTRPDTIIGWLALIAASLVLGRVGGWLTQQLAHRAAGDAMSTTRWPLSTLTTVQIIVAAALLLVAVLQWMR